MSHLYATQQNTTSLKEVWDLECLIALILSIDGFFKLWITPLVSVHPSLWKSHLCSCLTPTMLSLTQCYHLNVYSSVCWRMFLLWLPPDFMFRTFVCVDRGRGQPLLLNSHPCKQQYVLITHTCEDTWWKEGSCDPLLGWHECFIWLSESSLGVVRQLLFQQRALKNISNKSQMLSLLLTGQKKVYSKDICHQLSIIISGIVLGITMFLCLIKIKSRKELKFRITSDLI